MSTIERKSEDNVRKPEPIIINAQNALKTTPGVYYIAEGSNQMRAEIVEKINSVSQGKN